MIKVDSCPICNSKESLVIQIQKYECEVLNIINPKLNKIEINISLKTSIVIFISGISLIATPGGAGTAIKFIVALN